MKCMLTYIITNYVFHIRPMTSGCREKDIHLRYVYVSEVDLNGEECVKVLNRILLIYLLLYFGSCGYLHPLAKEHK